MRKVRIINQLSAFFGHIGRAFVEPSPQGPEIVNYMVKVPCADLGGDVKQKALLFYQREVEFAD
jgi:hypothetical protein